MFDLHYAHVQYFHEPNLLRLAARAGFEAVRRWQLKDGHDVGVLLRPQRRIPAEDAVWSPVQRSDDLRRRLEDRRARTRAWLVSLEGTVCLYGATAQGLAFLHAFQSDRRFVAVADDNPGYEGYALYSSEQRIPVVGPRHDALRGSTDVIITAYLHDAAITDRLKAAGFSGEIVSVRESPAFVSGAGR